MRTGHAGVRRGALDRLCELDGPEKAIRRAQSDPNAAVRKWRPATPQLAPAVLFSEAGPATSRAA